MRAAQSTVFRSSALVVVTGIAVALSDARTASSQIAASAANAAFFSDMKWRSIGPPRSGYISAPAGVPGDPTTYYIGTPEGGVWKTTNAGTTWKPIFDDVHVPSIGAVAVAPSEPNTVYVGTGNQSGWSFTPGDGVYKTTDGGRTWSNIGLRTSQYIGAIFVDPRNANTVLVAAQGGRGAAVQASAACIARLTAGARGRACCADGSAGASDLHVDYADPQTMYAVLTQSPGTGVFKSTTAA